MTRPFMKKPALLGTTLVPMIIAFGAGSSALAQQPQFDVTCEGVNDVRQVLVVTPGIKGKACDVIYTRNSGLKVSTPYFANTDLNYCLNKAASLRDKLKSSNYSCLGAGHDYRASDQSNSSQQASRQQASSQLNSSQRPPQEKTLSEKTSSDKASSEKIESVKAPIKVASPVDTPNVDAPNGVSADAETKELLNSLRDGAKSLEQQQDSVTSAQEVQNGLSKRETFLRELETSQQQKNDRISGETKAIEKPVAAVKTARADVEALVPAVSNTIKPGQVIGGNAQIADAPIKSAQTGPIALVTPEPISQTASRTVAGNAKKIQNSAANTVSNAKAKLVGATPVARSTTSAGSTAKPSNFLPKVFTNEADERLRTNKQIIEATLVAQAAAWNEGNIEAFMNGYWRDNDLRFVSGTEVTKGWSSTLRRYKTRYGDGAELGTLKFEEMDIQMVTDDVSIIVGRFHLTRDTNVDTGVFTLVMNKKEGAWRIVHDHTVGDMPEEQE